MYLLYRGADKLTGRMTRIIVDSEKESYIDYLAEEMYSKHFPFEREEGKLVVTNTKLTELLNILNGVPYSIEDDHLKKRASSIMIPPALAVNNKPKLGFKLPPYDIQMEAAKFMLKHKSTLLADKMGKGKTFTAMIASEYLKQATGGFKHVLVLNGISSNQYNWKSEVGKFSYESAYIIGEREIQRGPRSGRYRIGTNADKLKDLNSDIPHFYLIANIHMLRDRDILDRLKEMVSTGEIGYIVIDEVHKCTGITVPKDNDKNKKTRVNALDELKTYYRTAMSGTPFNLPTDIYDIEKWLGTVNESRTDYEKRYGMHTVDTAVMNIVSRSKKSRGAIPLIFVMTDHDKFKEHLDTFMIRRDSAEGLPQIIFTNYHVELYKEQLKALDDTQVEVDLKDLLTLDVEDAKKELQKGGYQHQRKVVSLPSSVGIEKDAKLDALNEILEEVTKNGDTAIVFTYYTDAATHYKNNITVEGGIYVETSNDVNETFDKVSSFQSGNGSFLVGSYGKIGTGHNIERADYLIFVDVPVTWNDYEQSIFRALRGTRQKPVNVVKLIAVDTYDEIALHNIGESKLQSDLVLGKTISDSAIT